MNSEAMLRELDEAGTQTGGEYHEGLNGWLGWGIEFYAPPAKKDRGILTMTFTTYGGEEAYTRRFTVMPL